MPTFLDGQTNIRSISNPGVYVDQILPTPFAVPAASNLEGYVGAASWGPVNTISKGSSENDVTGNCGPPQVRPFDLATYVLAGMPQGQSINFATVRVTDGTDTAATAALPNNAGTYTARYTGTVGDAILAAFQDTAAAGAYAAVIQFPGRQPERFDNIRQAISSLNVTAGAGYTSVPSLTVAAPGTMGGVTAIARASLAVVTMTLANGGTGHALNDILTFGAGVTGKVTLVNGGAVTGIQLAYPGSVTSGAIQPTAGLQVSSTGTGTGASVTLVWGLGPATILNPGYAYNGVPSITQSGGGFPGVAGAYLPIMSFWAALSYAVNNGTFQRAKSQCVVFSAGPSTAPPTIGVTYQLSGGTDGAAGLTSDMLVGNDVVPRSGMFALRGAGTDAFTLCDCLDYDTWATQAAFAQSESSFAEVSMESGSTIADAVAERANQGLDTTFIHINVGDYPSFYDTQNQITRLVNPAAIALGLYGNLSPEQSPINKRLASVIATESSTDGAMISDADETVAQNGGVDLIGQSTDLNVDYFSFLTGRNASSNTAANGVEYQRLTNFLVRTYEKAGKAIVGKLQSIQADDPTRNEAFALLSSLNSTLAAPTSPGGYGLIDTAIVQCDNNNNTPATQALGFLFAFSAVRYLNVVRYFVIQLQGGGNVDVTVYDTPQSISSLIG